VGDRPTEAWTRLDSRCAVFAVVDHCTGEAWVDAAPRGSTGGPPPTSSKAILDRLGYVEPAAAGPKLRTTAATGFARPRPRAFAALFNERWLLERPRLPPTPPSPRRPHRSRARHGMIVADKANQVSGDPAAAPRLASSRNA